MPSCCDGAVWGSISMKFRSIMCAATAICLVAGASAAGAKGESSGQKAQKKGQAQIPHCTHKIGTVAIVEPDDKWWRQLNLGSPEAILKVFVQEDMVGLKLGEFSPTRTFLGHSG